MRPSIEAPWSPELCARVLDGALPRLLSQIDRDPDSPTFGSCDRGFWMYRLHDFDSGVMQQAGLTLACLAALVREKRTGPETPNLRDADPAYLESVARAVNSRTARLLAHNGFLDEYYPGEQSYPGTVFAAYATLASAVMLEQSEIIEHAGLLATADRLLGREPSSAANQDVAAAAFLALYAKARGWRRESASATVRSLLAGPDGSGRCVEYGGGDLGYATVSLCHLAYILLDESHDCGEQLDELARFVADFVSPSGQLGGEFASRSTTYWLPFGVMIAARRDPEVAADLAWLDLASAYERLDDRYLMHYCLASLARTALEAHRGAAPGVGEGTAVDGWRVANHAERGLLALRSTGRAVFIGTHKGGAYSVESTRAADGPLYMTDAGYRLQQGDAVYATGVVDPEPDVEVEADEARVVIRVRCGFRRYRTLTASPNKTVALRVARVLGPNLNQYFKQRLITNAELITGPRLERTLRLDRAKNVLEVEDDVQGLQSGQALTVAPPVSLRLVPSARFWQAGEAEAFGRVGPADGSSTRKLEL
jgi:hypothetical protein